jgi:hypothetical protein
MRIFEYFNKSILNHFLTPIWLSYFRDVFFWGIAFPASGVLPGPISAAGLLIASFGSQGFSFARKSAKWFFADIIQVESCNSNNYNSIMSIAPQPFFIQVRVQVGYIK